MRNISTIGLDIAKSVFQVHGVDAAGEVVVRRKLTRGRVLAFFESLMTWVFPGFPLTSSGIPVNKSHSFATRLNCHLTAAVAARCSSLASGKKAHVALRRGRIDLSLGR